MTNKAALLTFMILLIIFVVLLTVLGIIFIIALRKRRPIVKVLMPSANDGKSKQESQDDNTSVDANAQPAEKEEVFEPENATQAAANEGPANNVAKNNQAEIEENPAEDVPAEDAADANADVKVKKPIRIAVAKRK